MQVITRGRNTTAKGLTFLSVILVLAVLRHVSRVTTFSDKAEADSSLPQSGGRRSLGFGLRSPQKATVTKPCLEHVSLQPPAVSAGGGAMADIKRILADRAHISDYVQSCDFQSQKHAKTPGDKTRGIVIPSAGHDMFAHTWVVVTVLRETLNCTLPIEVIYNGQEELDVSLAKSLKVGIVLATPVAEAYPLCKPLAKAYPLLRQSLGSTVFKVLDTVSNAFCDLTVKHCIMPELSLSLPCV